MEMPRFDILIRSLTTAASRRGVLGALSGGLLAASPFARLADDSEARKRGRRGKRKKNGKKRKDRKPKTRIDAACPGLGDSGGVFVLNAEDARLAQTFTAGDSGPLVRAELLIDKEALTFGDYVLQIGAVDDFGVPTDEVLASTSVGNLDVPDGESTVTFTFAKPASVVAGVQYALILARPGSNSFFWRGSPGDPCAGRAFISGTLNEPFLGTDIGLDLSFATFVRS